MGMVAVGLVALGLLVAMALTGGPPGLRHYVPFAPRGLMTEAPARITRLELNAGAHRVVLIREDAAGWRREGPGDVVPVTTLGSGPDMGIEFMHVSAPIRTFSAEEYTAADLGEFGLDPPRLTVTLLAGSRAILSADFGALNPMKAAQYVRVRGREEIHLLPLLVGREWESILTASLAGGTAPATGADR